MSQTATPHSPLNSGAINHVSYPASEAGLSLVQLTGTVTVSGTITGGVYLLKAATAFTTAGASASTARARLQQKIGAATDAAATGTAAQLGKNLRSAITSGTATGAAEVQRRLSVLPSAATASATSAPASVRSLVPRNALATAGASASANSIKRIFVTASGAASAVVAGNALRKVRFAAQTTGTASILAVVGRRRALSAAVNAAALYGLPAITRKMPLGASVAPSVLSQVTPLLAIGVRANATPSAANSVASLRMRFLLRSTESAVAQSVVTPALKYRLSAQATASFTGFTVALDYSITPAPIDRQMVVQFDNRRMEVAA